MSMSYTKDTTATINPRATLATCDRCHEHAPRFAAGTHPGADWLCPSCAVEQKLDELPTIAAEHLQKALIKWITRPNPALDCDDDTFYGRLDARTWTQRDLDDEAERNARKAWVASVCGDPEPTQDELGAAFMAEFWAALIEVAA